MARSARNMARCTRHRLQRAEQKYTTPFSGSSNFRVVDSSVSISLLQSGDSQCTFISYPSWGRIGFRSQYTPIRYRVNLDQRESACRRDDVTFEQIHHNVPQPSPSSNQRPVILYGRLCEIPYLLFLMWLPICSFFG
jgi:hypothetical protein